MVLISIADTLNNGSGFLTNIDSLLARCALHRVSIGVQWHDLSLDIVLNELERLSRSCIVDIHVRLLPIGSPQYGIRVGPNHILPDISNQLGLILMHVSLPLGFCVDRIYICASYGHFLFIFTFLILALTVALILTLSLILTVLTGHKPWVFLVFLECLHIECA